MHTETLYEIIADLIAERRKAHKEPQAVTWIEIYKRVAEPYDITGEQLQRGLNKLVEAQRVIRSRSLNYDMYYLNIENDETRD